MQRQRITPSRSATGDKNLQYSHSMHENASRRNAETVNPSVIPSHQPFPILVLKTESKQADRVVHNGVWHDCYLSLQLLEKAYFPHSISEWSEDIGLRTKHHLIVVLPTPFPSVVDVSALRHAMQGDTRIHGVSPEK